MATFRCCRKVSYEIAILIDTREEESSRRLFRFSRTGRYAQGLLFNAL